jgi:hypothetical protein
MNAAEHYARSEALLAELDSDDVQSYAGSKQVVAMVGLTHAVLSIAAEAGVSTSQTRNAKPAICLQCGYSEQSHTADAGPQGTGCDGSGPWAPAGTPAANAVAVVAP